ncbi:MAG: NAD(P)H-dependent oxidoreductase [Spirochaetaceae bacterium]|nr:NAD(P)H-dependent oxidoreductase [Spirochaetaceae bacterium]
MNIAVLNGSPKGRHSITLTYLNFLKTRFPEHQYSIIHISRDIRTIEKSRERFNEIMETINQADALIWLYGAWVLLVPAQMVRFMELVRERGKGDVFAGKYAASISTSIHYLDHFAEHYIRAESEDLKMQFYDHLSLDMRDLMKADKRNNLCRFFTYFADCAKYARPLPKRTIPLVTSRFHYEQGKPAPRLDTNGQKILVLSDADGNGTNLGKMARRFAEACGPNAQVVDISDLGMKGACTGCMRCGYDNTCIYSDGFQEFYNETVMNADIVVFAATISGRFLSSTFKTFIDRAYFWTHTPSLAGKTIGYLIEGPLAQNHNIEQFLEATATARQHALFAGIVTDECSDSQTLDSLIDQFAAACIQYSSDEYSKGFNFLMHGAHKVFRDYNWSGIRVVWQADHRFYREKGLYDFPQKNRLKNLIMSIVMLITRIPSLRKRYYSNLIRLPATRLQKYADTKLQKERSA